MKTHQTFGEMKALARGSLNGHYGVAIISCIDVLIISTCPVYLINYLFPGVSILETIGANIVSFIISCFIGVFEAGLSLIFLKICSNAPASLYDLFYGFKEKRNHFYFISFINTLLMEVCLMPYTIISSRNMIFELGTSKGELISLIIGLLAFLLLRMPIVQSNFLLVDFDSYTGQDALKYSFKIMKSNYGRYILFVLSFLPLALLGITSFGIGFFWIMPYIYAASAAFYLDLVRNHND